MSKKKVVEKSVYPERIYVVVEGEPGDTYLTSDSRLENFSSDVEHIAIYKLEKVGKISVAVI